MSLISGVTVIPCMWYWFNLPNHKYIGREITDTAVSSWPRNSKSTHYLSLNSPSGSFIIRNKTCKFWQVSKYILVSTDTHCTGILVSGVIRCAIYTNRSLIFNALYPSTKRPIPFVCHGLNISACYFTWDSKQCNSVQVLNSVLYKSGSTRFIISNVL